VEVNTTPPPDSAAALYYIHNDHLDVPCDHRPKLAHCLACNLRSSPPLQLNFSLHITVAYPRAGPSRVHPKRSLHTYLPGPNLVMATKFD